MASACSHAFTQCFLWHLRLLVFQSAVGLCWPLCYDMVLGPGGVVDAVSARVAVDRFLACAALHDVSTPCPHAGLCIRFRILTLRCRRPLSVAAAMVAAVALCNCHMCAGVLCLSSCIAYQRAAGVTCWALSD
ncbi:hypothetical protein COO60DRAFT_1475976 [Scenedesmus sp. NREL 46B-D3]|nr:hypothetical protein COO60DRAFT_1475976 [Scenedesmus sp. NREL 46B-D3]